MMCDFWTAFLVAVFFWFIFICLGYFILYIFSISIIYLVLVDCLGYLLPFTELGCQLSNLVL